jgi:hypothetical protein
VAGQGFCRHGHHQVFSPRLLSEVGLVLVAFERDRIGVGVELVIQSEDLAHRVYGFRGGLEMPCLVPEKIAPFLNRQGNGCRGQETVPLGRVLQLFADGKRDRGRSRRRSIAVRRSWFVVRRDLPSLACRSFGL